MKWRCTVCNYIHEGDHPPDICPVCGADVSKFVKIEDTSAPVNQAEKPQKEESSIVNPTEAIINAVRTISYGLFIISANADGKDNGQAANTCFQITSDPVQIAIGINKNNYTHELISKSGKFGVSILDQTGHDLVRRFGYRSGREFEKFQGIEAHRGSSGVMLPDNVLATLEAEVVNQMDTGTHTLFLGKVTAGELRGKGEPMTYDYFRRTK